MSDRGNMLNQEGIKLYQQGKFSDAIVCFTQVCTEAKKVFGENHPNYAAGLNNLAELYRTMGEYSKAEPLYRHAIDIWKKELGKDHPNYAAGMNNLAELYRAMGEYSKAEPLCKQATDIRKRILGGDHPDYATSLNNLAGLYQAMGEYSKAEPLYKQATDIRKRILGGDHPNYATSLNNLAGLYQAMGEYSKAEPLCKQAIDIRKRILGGDHPDYATSLNNLAGLYQAMGEYSKAEPLHKQAADIRKRILGENHPDYAKSLNNLALLYHFIGEYSKAELLYKKAADIRKKVLGEDHPDYAQSLNNLAGLYQDMGEYGKAEPLHKKATDIWKRTLGEDHPDYAANLTNLAALYEAIGEYSKAESLYRQATDIRKRVQGEDHPEYAQSLNNLAEIYESMGEYSKAELLYKQAMDIWEKVLGEDHPDFATSLDNLATLYQAMGEYSKAEPLYKQATDIKRKVLGEGHPNFAASLNNLAALYDSMGEYRKAEPLFRQATNIIMRSLGENHPNYATSLNNLAGLEIILNKPQDALDRMIEATIIDNRMITQMFSMGDEKRVAEYINTFQINYYTLLSNFAQHYPILTEYAPQVFDVILKRKAINLEIAAIKRDNIVANKNPDLQVRFKELRQKRMAFAGLIMAGPGKTTPAIYQENIQQLEQEIISLERELASQIPQVELEKKLAGAEHNAIASLLPDDTNLVEYIWFRNYDFKNHKYLNSKYIALILYKDNPDDIQMIDLGEASAIDGMITKYRDEIIQGCGRDLGVGVPEGGKSIEYDSNNNRLLYQKLFQPIIDNIGETKKLIISPDGNITLLPFEVLQQPDGRYLIEDFEISYVDSGRDLLRFTYHENPQTKALILADPDFDLAASSKKIDRADIRGRRSYELEQVLRDERMIKPGSSYYFGRLPGTQAEGESIKKLMDTDVWMQDKALDAKLKQIQGPKILHIATHGFFMPKQPEDDQDLLRRMMVGFTDKSLSIGKTNENPLLRSGLALAGVNAFIQGEEPVQDAEDGILTALDVTGMDLIGTDLVVLSACETGLGEVQAGEGIYGLRRAFIIAGARTLIVSLWKVPDNATKELMVDFYQRILRGGKKAVALREAQREMIKKLRKEGRQALPYLWGAFVCVGDPGAMGK